MSKFTDEELKTRAYRRVARILFEQWEESPKGDRGDTRLFDWLVDDRLTCIGRSAQGAHHREHVVPRRVIRELCIKHFAQGGTVEAAAELIRRLLLVARISKVEAHHLDVTLKLRTRMPEGWDPDSGDVLARLDAAGIVPEGGGRWPLSAASLDSKDCTKA